MPIWRTAGNGTLGFVYGVTGLSAEFAHPVGLAIGSNDNLYVADQQNHRIAQIDTSGNVTAIAGSGASTNGNCTNGTFGGDGGLALSATLNCPQGVAVVTGQNLVISDSNDRRIRVVNLTASAQTFFGQSICALCIQTVYGTGSNSVVFPLGLGLAPSGNLLIADYFNNRILKMTPAGQLLTYHLTRLAVSGSNPSFLRQHRKPHGEKDEFQSMDTYHCSDFVRRPGVAFSTGRAE